MGDAVAGPRQHGDRGGGAEALEAPAARALVREHDRAQLGGRERRERALLGLGAVADGDLAGEAGQAGCAGWDGEKW